MISRRMLGVLGMVFVAGLVNAQTCYEDGTASCEELTGEFGHDCSSVACDPVYNPITGSLWGYRCPPGEKNQNLRGPINVAVHTDFGLDSFSGGATVNCVTEQDCKNACGFPAPNETLFCEGEGEWTDSYPYSHTTASGNSCEPEGYMDECCGP